MYQVRLYTLYKISEPRAEYHLIRGQDAQAESYAVKGVGFNNNNAKP